MKNYDPAHFQNIWMKSTKKNTYNRGFIALSDFLFRKKRQKSHNLPVIIAQKFVFFFVSFSTLETLTGTIVMVVVAAITKPLKFMTVINKFNFFTHLQQQQQQLPQ